MSFHEELIGLAEETCDEVAGKSRRLLSGPLRDATEMARLVPTVMLFVKSPEGPEKPLQGGRRGTRRRRTPSCRCRGAPSARAQRRFVGGRETPSENPGNDAGRRAEALRACLGAEVVADRRHSLAERMNEEEARARLLKILQGRLAEHHRAGEGERWS
ncbi:MAG: hypothetical protein M3317_14645 [Actinomycetota bacterium]|nr:hypothetical protein [Actinomycetota bacterium]